ncbi:MAG: disease resistance protein TAO1-like isoform [Chitinophagaceae bacterium]|nr:disease resistance protein TAO1-like isoform [Chitinophagaceae bacterium]
MLNSKQFLILRIIGLLLVFILTSCAHSGTKVYHSTTAELKSDKIPAYVFEMTELTDLSIQGMDCDYRVSDDQGNDITQCWMIYEIPPEIKRLKHLESLRLNVNAITKLPPEIGELKQLKSLDLSDNLGLSDIQNVTALSNLEHLSLYGCSLDKLPADIGKLSKLTYLGLSGNAIDYMELARIRQALPDCEVVF